MLKLKSERKKIVNSNPINLKQLDWFSQPLFEEWVSVFLGFSSVSGVKDANCLSGFMMQSFHRAR